MIRYRSFHNSDPPKIASLWSRIDLGRGMVRDVHPDLLEYFVFSQPHFDREGFITASDGDQLVGFIHAGFGPDSRPGCLSVDVGAVCLIIVHPEYRRSGIGRELVRHAEEFLRARGATEVVLGSASPIDPFYVGLYGGVRPAGLLESDAGAGEFCEALGYQPAERHLILQRDLRDKRDPVSPRLQTNRRQLRMDVTDDPIERTWWWSTRFGRLDNLTFRMHAKTGNEVVAAANVAGLDQFLTRWNERVVGITDVFVPETHRRRGYAQSLLVEICRRLRRELFTRVEMHAPESDSAAVGLVESAGFECVDRGTVYRRATVNAADESAASPVEPP